MLHFFIMLIADVKNYMTIPNVQSTCQM